ncbi:hypothetical protein [Streptomyces bohaiensis]|uniref:hypothetical protein n=1 Tax=Streptomyces bohaiensis TaxID=1431344 RepID=UPI003B7FCCC7
MSTWLRLFGAELRRTLLRPLPVGLLLLMAVGATVQALSVQDVAHGNLAQVRSGADQLTPAGCAADASNLPADAGVSPDAFYRDCVTGLPRTVEMYQRIEAGFLDTAQQLAPAQHPLGAIGAAFGWLATAPGLLAVLVLAAHFTAGEWSRGTAVPLLLHEQRLWRLLSAKAAVLLTWFLATAAAMALSLWLLAVAHTRRSAPLLGLVSDSEVRAFAAQRVAVGLLVILVASFAAVALAAALRSPLRTVLVGVLVLGVLTLPLTAWFPGAVLADALRLQPHLNAWDHVWSAPTDSAVPPAVRALPWLLALAAAVWHGWRVRPRSLV